MLHELFITQRLDVGLKKRIIYMMAMIYLTQKSKEYTNIKITMKTPTTRIIIQIVTKTKMEIKTKTNTEMTVMTKLEVGPRKKSVHMMIEKMIALRQNLKECTKFYKQ